MAKKSFAELKKEILAAQQPDPAVLATMRRAVRIMLANLEGLRGIPLKRDQFYDLLAALLEESYPTTAVRLIEDIAVINEEQLLLGGFEVGRAPGLFKVQVTWRGGQTVAYFSQVPTGQAVNT